MKLFHYTSAAHLRGIHKYGLTVGDVITNFERVEGRIAVWLTSSMNPQGHGLSGSLVDKTEFRLTVEIDEHDDRFWKWTAWAKENLDLSTQLRIRMSDGFNADSWYLWFARVPTSQILEVASTKTGRRIENWGDYYPEVISARPVPYENRHAWHQKTLRDVRRAMERLAS
ncbi:hypothetical protein [Agrobacterium pusense]|uniref:hypothetical protein n=1 Tax=Agrobacterium pusense TaxID=648995 RepID=UPI000D19B1FB|nr:hypothetical protein [Agrobacterium pusense]